MKRVFHFPYRGTSICITLDEAAFYIHALTEELILVFILMLYFGASETSFARPCT